jgi:hypothetical protein
MMYQGVFMKTILTFILMALMIPNRVSAYEYKAEYNQKFNSPSRPIPSTVVTVPVPAPVTTTVNVPVTTVSQQLPSQCQYANAIITTEFSDWAIFPTSTYVKEGDKICFIAQGRGTNGTSFSIQNYPVAGSMKNGEDKVFVFYARKKGTWKINCLGTCREANATITVLSASEFQGMEDKANKERSLNSRQRVINGY